jgi:mannose-6-phosphate isomerase
MTIEHARAQLQSKPWGVAELSPFSSAKHDDQPIGEIWFEREGEAAAGSSLLLKLLFTSQPLSIQVHPNDAYAQSLGLPNGKTEAWHVLSATSEAKVALGLKRSLTPLQLEQAIDDGSIADLVVWRTVQAGDTILVPAGTIHAIGEGLVIAEIQQRSDATFRIFDYGRGRELHIAKAIAVSIAEPADAQLAPRRLTDTRTLLASNPYFTFEKIDLASNSAWQLNAKQETWLLVIAGGGNAGAFDVAAGDVIFAQSDRIRIAAGSAGLIGLVAYTGVNPTRDLLEHVAPDMAATGPMETVQ